MQNLFTKIIHLFFIFILFSGQNAYSQVSTDLLKQADSLFAQRKYIQSLEIYKKILTHDQIYSASMLLKMAYMAEGLGEYTNTLYYLNLYYIQKPRVKTLLKIEKIATKHNLKGYEVNDIDYLKTYYQQYFNYITLILINFCLFFFILLGIRKYAKTFFPLRYGIAFIALLSVTFILLNFIKIKPKGIITTNNIYLMSDASAGSSKIGTLNKGDCLQIDNQKDIWWEVTWNNQKAYILKSKIWLIKSSF